MRTSKGRATFPDTNTNRRMDRDFREYLHPEKKHHGTEKTFIEEGRGDILRAKKSIAPKYVGAAETSMAIATKWAYGQNHY